MNPYGINQNKSNLQGPLVSLKVLYEGMPKTFGCDQCFDVNGEDKEWCCRKNSPSMYYVEFLYVFKHILKEWSCKHREELLLRSVRNYLDNSLSKGCVLYEGHCSIYEHRFFSCRQYGVVPKESWDKRWESLKKRQGDKFEALPQCTLVSAEKEITVAQENKWFKHIKTCEERIGVPSSRIELHDDAGGSYRTFHDHFLLEMLGEEAMCILSDSRITNPSKEDIDATIEEIKKIVNKKTLCS